MNNFYLTLLFVSLAFGSAFSQTAYDDYTDEQKEYLLNEEFNNNENNWNVRNNSAEKSFVDGGYLTIQSLEDASRNVSLQLNIDQEKDFEIETRFKIVSDEGSTDGQFLFWGANTTDKYEFGYNTNNKYTIDKYDNNRPTGQKYVDYVSFTFSDYIEEGIYNKMTVRKVGDELFFFINKKLVHQQEYEQFFGNGHGVKAGGNTTVKVDYFKVAYLTEKTDQIAPEITLIEPMVSRGLTVEDDLEQVKIKGTVLDESGVQSVTINGKKCTLTASGAFTNYVTLTEGKNTISIKATDNFGNVGSYTFHINKKIANSEYNESANNNEKRIALVIGNANYASGQTLKNPTNDANLMATSLEKLGFEVIKRVDASKQSMEQAVREFSRKLPNYNVALFYYAGHGLQVDGQNYLIPTDAKLNEKSDCKFEALAVNFVVEEFEKYPNNVNIVILDACRNNPFRSWARGNEQGFRAVSPTSGTIISFATSEGSTASDGTGNNGLFTEELVRQMNTPQPIENVFKKTRVVVQKRSNGGQVPQEWSQLTGDFYFKKQ